MVFDAVRAGAVPPQGAGSTSFFNGLAIVAGAADAVVAGGIEPKGAARPCFFNGATGSTA